jgi:hypothetical protein
MVGRDPKTIANWFDGQILSGHRDWRSQNRRVSRTSILKWAHANRVCIPQIGMYPYTIVTLGLGRVEADAVGRAATAVDAVVERAETATDFGILVAPGESCCGVVDTSIGTAIAKDCARAVRRWEQTEKMLMIAVCDDSQPTVGFADAGFDFAYQRPFNPAKLVRRITGLAREYQEAAATKGKP